MTGVWIYFGLLMTMTAVLSVATFLVLRDKEDHKK